MRRLKYIRVGVAIVFFLATLSTFVDITHLLPTNWYNYVLSFQFVPSFLKLLRGVSFFAFGLVIFSILALIAGRWYCSFICPLGILQDVFIRVNTYFSKKRKRFIYKNSWPWLKYVVLGFTIISLLFGATFMLVLLDPYSNFGRIATHIFQPMFLFLNNSVAVVANKLGFYELYHIEFQAFDFVSFLFAMGIMVLLVWLTRKRGRLFCNTLCPVGSFLGTIAQVSIYKLKFDSNKCIACSRCEHECKAESIDYKNMKIDFNRCISCFNCVDTCPERAITYQRSQKDEPIKSDQNKRNSIKTIFASLFTISGLSLTIDTKSFSSFVSEKPAKSKSPVMPPGAISLDHYKSTCTACHLCVSACPTKVIQSTFSEYGWDAPFVPYMNYSVQYCQYECNLCGQICPTGAIKPLALDNKKVTQIGKVTFIKENCVVSQLEKDCGACAEHCPTKAVKMVPFPNSSGKELFIPEVDTDLCIGCGACEHPCPVRPHKAIYVESNLNHALAQKPVIENVGQKESVDEEFPF